MNDFLHLALLGNFGGGEIILIFLMLLFLAVPVAVVLLVVFLMKKNKNPGPDPQGPPPTPLGQNPTSAPIAGLLSPIQPPTSAPTAASLYDPPTQGRIDFFPLYVERIAAFIKLIFKL